MADKYQLPSLSPINISLTEGTQIPAPLDSPPETPLSPAPGRGPLSSHPTTPLQAGSPVAFPLSPSATAQPEPPPQPLQETATGSSANENMAQSPKPGAAPGIAKRPSSVRRFLGLRSLGSSDSLRSKATETNGGPGSSVTDPTQQSPAAAAASPGGQGDSPNKLKRKSSSGWFGSRRKSSIVLNRLEENGEQEKPKKRGPPPPKIPEFTALGTELDGGSLGADDMFKNIK